MIKNTVVTFACIGSVLVGCTSVTPTASETNTEIQQNCSVILSSHVSDEQRWQVYNDLLQAYAVHSVHQPSQLERLNAFIDHVKANNTGQLATELIEVTDWGCANGNYLEEMTLFIQEVQK